MKRQPSGPIRDFIEKYQCSASWLAEQLGVTDRTIWKIKSGFSAHVYPKTRDAFLELLIRVEMGATPPTRQERRDQALELTKGASGFWGVLLDPILGRWTGYFQYEGVQRTTSACKTKALAIDRALELAKALGAKTKIGVTQLKFLKKPWRAWISKRVNGRWVHCQLGHFATAEEAARAHDEAARKEGRTKRLNFPIEEGEINVRRRITKEAPQNHGQSDGRQQRGTRG